MSKLVNLTVEELIEEIELLQWEKGIEVFKITEETNGVKRTYLLRNLKLEHEDGILVGSDADDILLENFNSMELSAIALNSYNTTIIKEDSLTYKITLDMCFNNYTSIIIKGLED